MVYTVLTIFTYISIHLLIHSINELRVSYEPGTDLSLRDKGCVN